MAVNRRRTLAVATFNVNGIRTRLPHLIAWLRQEAPDVACLQELKAVDEGFPRAELEAEGYHARWVGQRSWNGVAVLTRGEPAEEVRRSLPWDPGDSHARYLEVDAFGLRVACLYLPNGNPQPGPKFDYKLKWFDRLIRHARKLHALEQPVVMAGDYNVVPTDEDIYNPRSWRKDALLQPESRERYAKLLEAGWVDAIRERHPDDRVYTFWDYFRQHWERDAGLRIDHLLLNPAAAARLKAAGVDRWVRALPKPSDHAPAWITLAGATRPARRRRGA
ncbi:exodeoxyribonuclease III [Pseudoxanthomonas sp.]|uniref:exodeoxyribonuclease III n=1 Tax=Pseudoxanthomonas sp. TaxID=1871049 RepID=UPI003F7FEA5F